MFYLHENEKAGQNLLAPASTGFRPALRMRSSCII